MRISKKQILFVHTVTESEHVEGGANRYVEQKIVCNTERVLQRVANLAEFDFREIPHDNVEGEQEILGHREGSRRGNSEDVIGWLRRHVGITGRLKRLGIAHRMEGEGRRAQRANEEGGFMGILNRGIVPSARPTVSWWVTLLVH